jgi:choline dehydrogenase-like flavoprotein
MAKTDVQHDVIVIGAGIAGLVAANRAAQLGKRVIVLEKSKEEKYLCNSRYTYGTFHINFTDVGADEDVLFGKIEACSEGLARKDLARAIAKNGRRLMPSISSISADTRPTCLPRHGEKGLALPGGDMLATLRWRGSKKTFGSGRVGYCAGCVPAR